MGMTADAELAYGYQIDDGEFASLYDPTDEYEVLLTPWFSEDNPKYRDEDDPGKPAPLEQALVWELYNAIPADRKMPLGSAHFQREEAIYLEFGVRLATWGDHTSGYNYGSALVLAEPVIETLCGIGAIPDPALISRIASDPEVVERFERVHRILGITPKDNNSPRWLLLPSYG